MHMLQALLQNAERLGQRIGAISLKKMEVGGAVTRAKRPSSNPNVARGCGIVMSNKRKETKYS